MKLKTNKDKLVKVLKIFIIIIIVLLVLRKIHEIYVKYDGKLDKSNPMSKEEIVELLDKGIQKNNNYVRIEFESYNSKKILRKTFVKDNLIREEYNDKTYFWKDYNELETIHFGEFPEAYITKGLDIVDSITYYKNICEHFRDINYNVEYLGEKEINDRKTIAVKLVYGTYDKSYDKIFIDRETGVVINEVSIMYNYRWHIWTKSEVKQMVEFGNVTDEDVKRPSTAGWIVETTTIDELSNEN